MGRECAHCTQGVTELLAFPGRIVDLTRRDITFTFRAAGALASHTNEESVLTTPKSSPFFSSSLSSPKLKLIIITILKLSPGKLGHDLEENQLFLGQLLS